MPDQAPPSTDNKVEIIHIIAQFATVVAAMALVYFVVDLSMGHLGDDKHVVKASDVVAVVGAVTTFLGTAIGLFFGVAVGQAGKKAADTAAQNAQQHAKDSANLAQQAQAVTRESLAMADKAQGTTQSAVNQLQDYQSQIQALKINSDRLTTTINQLRELVNPIHAHRASAILKSMISAARPSNSKIQEIVSDVVCAQIVRLGGEASPDLVDTSRKISASPPDGYGIDGEFYVRFCSDCVATINSQCASTVDANDPKLQGDSVVTLDKFIDDAAHLAIDNPA